MNAIKKKKCIKRDSYENDVNRMGSNGKGGDKSLDNFCVQEKNERKIESVSF